LVYRWKGLNPPEFFLPDTPLHFPVSLAPCFDLLCQGQNQWSHPRLCVREPSFTQRKTYHRYRSRSLNPRSFLLNLMPPFCRNRTLFEADPWEGLFRAATTSPEAATGAEKSVGYGGSPEGCPLRLAPWIAPTPRMTSLPRGRLKALSPFPVAVSSQTFPWVGYRGLFRNLRRTSSLRL
jgi:hypothetical protein